MLTSVETVMDRLDDYFCNNDLVLNVLKTQCILFGNRTHNEFHLTYNSENITSAKHINFLGINIDDRLDWGVHVGEVAASLSRYCYALRIVRERAGIEAALTAYHGYIDSRIRYGLIFWGNSRDIKRVFILQKRCIRNIFSMSLMESCKPVFVCNQILTVTCLYIMECVMFVFRNKDLFEACRLDHSYNTRYASNLICERYVFSFLQRNVTFMMMKIYNFLPEKWRAMTWNRLKSTLKHFLIDKAFYNLDEFFNSDMEELNCYS